MTLDTRFAITDPVIDPREVFNECNRLLAVATGWPVERIVFSGRHNGWHNLMGQGLVALLDVEYGPDGPIKRGCYCEDREPDDAPDWMCSYCRAPQAFVEVSFDTAYSYQGPAGLGCGDLHALLVGALGAWCDERGLTWWWHNEFTGDWHEGRDGLAELGDPGRAAGEWFVTKALPTLAARTERI